MSSSACPHDWDDQRGQAPRAEVFCLPLSAQHSAVVLAET